MRLLFLFENLLPAGGYEWLENGTVVCPHCNIDSVLGSMSGYPLTKEFLEEMNKRWFRVTRRPQRQKNTRKAILEITTVASIDLILEFFFPNNIWVLVLVIAGFTTVAVSASYESSKIKRTLRPGSKARP